MFETNFFVFAGHANSASLLALSSSFLSTRRRSTVFAIGRIHYGASSTLGFLTRRLLLTILEPVFIGATFTIPL
jgi:hypothetical protein